MPDQKYNEGGWWKPAKLARIELHPDECIVAYRDGKLTCVRADHDCNRNDDG